MGDLVELHHLLDLPVPVAVVVVLEGQPALLVVMEVGVARDKLVVLEAPLKVVVVAVVVIVPMVQMVKVEQTLTGVTGVQDSFIFLD
jgi:hypothetical protein